MALATLLVWALSVVTPPVAGAAVLPTGFAVQDLPSGQSELLTDFAFAPDGSYFTTGKNGRVAWVSADGRARTLRTLSVVTVQDLGLTGIAVAHDYATSRTVYTTRTMPVADRWIMRLSAWQVTGSPEPLSIDNERIIWDLPADADVHAMTDIVTASDGTLWVTVGDAADFRFMDRLALRALDLNVGYGKLLHVRPDGQGVASNPYYDPAAPSSWRSRVWASGFRSPFRMTLDPSTGVPVLGDVGWRTWEEVDVVQRGASYGWPCWEGNTPTPEYSDLAACAGVPNTPPLWTYVHGPAGTSVTGGIVYTGSAYPEQYRGAYFFGDYASRRLYTLRYDAQGRLVRPPETAGFASDIGGPVAFGAAPNGDVVYADIGSARLKRLVYVPGNRPPTAVATATNDPTTRTVSFDGRGSSDLDGGTLAYRWEFGDGTTGSGATVRHTYAAPGTAAVTARLTVTDPQGATGTTTLTVVPANATPTITLQAPPPDRRFRVGEIVEATATATDPEDGALPVTWSTVLVHCSGGYCHDHPGETFTGSRYSRPFEDHGDQTTLYVSATATDRTGARVQSRFVAAPLQRTLTLAASTPALLAVNGLQTTTAQITVGATLSVTAPLLAADGASTFDRWSDGAPRERTLVMPDRDLRLEATYLTPIERRYRDEAALRSLVGLPVSSEIATGRLRYRDHQRGRLYWSAAAGVHETHGRILTKYLADGGHTRFGEPVTDELALPDGVGRRGDFALLGASYYWSSTTGAHAVYGEIGKLYRSMGAERSKHGYPRSDELRTPGGRGRFTDFVNGGIYYLPGVGACSVHGAIYATWGRYGYEQGHLGFPVTSERATPDGLGRYNHFEGGSVYWTSRTGAHEIRGSIKARWAALGWELSYLGYPTSDEFAIAGGRRSNFERGYITWDAASGRVVDRRY